MKSRVKDRQTGWRSCWSRMAARVFGLFDEKKGWLWTSMG
jgi:hypothetical protein